MSPGILFTLSLVRLFCEYDPQACAAPDTDVPCRVVIHEGPVDLEQGSAEPSSAYDGPADSPRTLQDWIHALGVERRLVCCSVQMAKCTGHVAHCDNSTDYHSLTAYPTLAPRRALKLCNTPTEPVASLTREFCDSTSRAMMLR